MKTCLRLAGMGALIAVALLAQGLDQRKGDLVRGEISPLPAGMGLLTLELSADGTGPSQTTTVGPDGTFEFRSTQPGTHELRLFGAGGVLLYRETVIVGGPNQTLSIHLPEPSMNRRTTDNTISMQQLTHKVPTQARKAFDKGELAMTKGNHQQAEGLFRQAVTIDPEYADAFNELGAAEAMQGHLPQAIEDFQKAVNVVPEHRLALSNLSIVLAKAWRFAEAAEVARRALRIVPGSATIHYILATSLLFVKGYTDEVREHLERSASEVPHAHLLVAELLAQQGKRTEAIRHLEEYLRVVPADDKQRDRAETMLAELRS
jgi:tetratricopeptide (TPR) repeat protein